MPCDGLWGVMILSFDRSTYHCESFGFFPLYSKMSFREPACYQKCYLGLLHHNKSLPLSSLWVLSSKGETKTDILSPSCILPAICFWTNHLVQEQVKSCSNPYQRIIDLLSGFYTKGLGTCICRGKYIKEEIILFLH